MRALDFPRAGVQYAAGLALALSGNAFRSETTCGPIWKSDFPEDTFVKLPTLPSFHALAELRQGKAANAVGPSKSLVDMNWRRMGSVSVSISAVCTRLIYARAFMAEHRYAESGRPSFRRLSLIAG